MVDVAADCHFQTSGKCLEDALNLVVLVLTLCLDVEVHACGIAEALEEMEEHLGWHLSNLLTVELGIPNEPWSSTKVKGYGAKAVVHWQRIAIALNASLVAKSL